MAHVVPELVPNICSVRGRAYGLAMSKLNGVAGRSRLADMRPRRRIASGAVNETGRPTAVDLFAGAGGLSLGLEQAGFDVVTAVEYDPVHAAVHAFNFPQTQVLCADAAKLGANELRASVRRGYERHDRDSDAWDGEVDLVAGGPPCQGFSTIGKRLIDDTRNRLVFHFFRLVAGLRPRYFAMENVPGMRAGGHASILDRLVEEFKGIGYVVRTPQILNAADFGAPQDRKRLVLIGSRADQTPAEYPQPTVTPVAKRPDMARRSSKAGSALPLGPNVLEAIGDLPDLDSFPELIAQDWVRLSSRRLAAAEAASSAYARRLRGLDSDPTDFGYRRSCDAGLLTSSRRTKHTGLSVSRFASTAPGATEPVSRFYRLHPEGLSNTLRAGTGSERGAYTSPRPIHPYLARVLSVREAARLHSFPDWFRFNETKWHGFRQIGNAVVPLVGRAVGASIASALGATAVEPDLLVELGEPQLLRFTMAAAVAHFGAAADAIPAPRQRAVRLAAA